jgi:hypothetical protein
MAVGLPLKTTYADGDVYSASDVNDTNGTINITAAPYAAGKNKIINGNMVIDQRNAGAAVTVNSTTSQYPVDRFRGRGESTDGVFTLQQDTSVPAGFSKSVKATVTTADASIGSTQMYFYTTLLEGQTIADFDFGTANAKTITLSFWVRSSLTGTFGGSVRNGTSDRSYPYSYSISVADTWEKKTITLAGDTSGTWVTTNAVAMSITWALGAGTDRVGTAGAWNANNNVGVTGQTQVISTLNATWYITGVQLEIGNVATAFQTATGTIQGELAACQRYFEFIGGKASGYPIIGGYATAGISAYFPIAFKASKRISPTVTKVGTWAVGNTGQPSPNYIGVDGFSSLQTATATGAFFTYPDSTDDGFNCDAEL